MNMPDDMTSNMPPPGQSLNGHLDQEAVEQDIREICAEVLGRPLEKVKMKRSFLAQGGDSLQLLDSNIFQALTRLVGHCSPYFFLIHHFGRSRPKL